MKRLNKIIENETPYIGNVVLKFEKYPNIKNKHEILNKIHFDFGFTKLVSKIIPYRDDEDDFLVNSNKIRLIERYTMGLIRPFYIKGTNKYIKNSFVSLTNKYIGDIMVGWKFYKEHLIVVNEYPSGVAIKLKKPVKIGQINLQKGKKYENFIDEQIITNNINGILVFNVKCWNTINSKCEYVLNIGDRIFDSNYTPIPNDYDEWEWTGYVEESIELGLNISDIIPKERFGKKIIENWTDGLVSAINLSKYINLN